MDPVLEQPVVIGGTSAAGRELAQSLLTVPLEELRLPPGEILLLTATGDPRPRWSWTLPLEVLVTTARLLPAVAGRQLTVVSPMTAGPGHPAGTLDPETARALSPWLTRLEHAAAGPCPPWRVAGLCRDFIALSERLPALAGDDLTLARLSHRTQRFMIEQAAQPGAARFIAGHPLAAGSGEEPVPHRLGPSRTRSPRSGTRRPPIDPPIPVVIPPRLAEPDVVADRQQDAIWTGLVKHGNRWTGELTERLRHDLALAPDDELLVTRSGTDALRLALAATVGIAAPGDAAVLPSFTYRATADVLIQLGYELRYADVDPWSWTLDPAGLHTALAGERVRLVMCVDTFGNPCAYEPLRALCLDRGVPLIADSAAALGSLYRGTPVGTQGSAHTFSMSFAKVLTSAGAGGALVLPAGSRRHHLDEWLGSALMDELHAVAALDQLSLLPELVARRARLAQAYQDVAQDLPGVVTQGCAPGNRHSYVHWAGQFPRRDVLASELAALGVLTKPYFPAQHLHHRPGQPGQPWQPGQPGPAPARPALPVTERLDREALALPMSSELSDRQAEQLASAFAEAAERVETRAAGAAGAAYEVVR